MSLSICSSEYVPPCMSGNTSWQSNSVGVRILTFKRSAKVLESCWVMSISSRRGATGRESATAAHRPSFFDTNFLDSVSKMGIVHRRLYSACPTYDGLTRASNDLRSCISLVDNIVRMISENFPAAIWPEEITIAFNTPSADGGCTNVPKTAEWFLTYVGNSFMIFKPSVFKTFVSVSSRQSSFRHLTTTLEGRQSRTKVTGVWVMLSGIRGRFPRL